MSLSTLHLVPKATDAAWLAEVGLWEETSMDKNLHLEKADILQMQRNYTMLEASSAEQIPRGTLPAVRKKKQEVNIYHLLPHRTRLTDQLSNFQQKISIFTGNFSFSLVNSNQGNTLAHIHHRQPAGPRRLPRASPSSFLRLFVTKSSISTSPEHDHSWEIWIYSVILWCQHLKNRFPLISSNPGLSGITRRLQLYLCIDWDNSSKAIITLCAQLLKCSLQHKGWIMSCKKRLFPTNESDVRR